MENLITQNGNCCHTANVSKYVNYQLQPKVQHIPSYIQETNDFLRKINKIEKLPDNSNLVSLDVRSLYASSESIKAIKTSLEKFLRRTVATNVITTFLSVILTLNNFFKQLQKLFTNKRLLHANNLQTSIC